MNRSTPQRSIVRTVLILLVSSGAGSVAFAAQGSFVLNCGGLLDLVSAEHRSGARIVVTAGRISAVGANVRAPAGAEESDAHSLWSDGASRERRFGCGAIPSARALDEPGRRERDQQTSLDSRRSPSRPGARRRQC